MFYSGAIFESYIKSLLSGNNLITLIVIIPLALYLFNKVEHYFDKNATQSSNSKKILKGLKDYGEKNGIMINVIPVKKIL